MPDSSDHFQAVLKELREHYVLPSDTSVHTFLTGHRALPYILLAAAPHQKLQQWKTINAGKSPI